MPLRCAAILQKIGVKGGASLQR
ncbi:unnamed protein product [Victoria cruziana]